MLRDQIRRVDLPGDFQKRELAAAQPLLYQQRVALEVTQLAKAFSSSDPQRC